MISRPVQADIGFLTKFPGLVGEQTVTPDHAHMIFLPDEVRLA